MDEGNAALGNENSCTIHHALVDFKYLIFIKHTVFPVTEVNYFVKKQNVKKILMRDSLKTAIRNT